MVIDEYYLMKLLYSRGLAREKLKKVKEDIAKLPVKPGLGVLLVGDNPASRLYVLLKKKMAERLGVLVKNINLPETVSDEEIKKHLKILNADSFVHGILLQTPVPGRADIAGIVNTLSLKKDVDGFLPASGISSPTVLAIIDSLKLARVELAGKKAALLVKNELFYQGIEKALKKEAIEITDNLAEADIVVIAKGVPGFLCADMVKNGVIVIDVGINIVNGKAVGDSNPDIAEKAAFLTPVPGGVGPLTRAHIFENLVLLVKGVL